MRQDKLGASGKEESIRHGLAGLLSLCLWAFR
jgi:hypothetical protein